MNTRTSLKLLLATTSLLPLLYAADNTTPGWKLDADGHIVLKDGNPVYINTSGVEATVGSETISSLNKESRKFREGLEAAELKLKAFEGLDATVAKDAIEKLKNVDQKKLIDSGRVDEVKAEITKQYEAKLAEQTNALTAANKKIDDMTVNNVFNGSKFVTDSLAVPKDMFEATFRGNFKVEDGKVVAYGKDGNKLMSKTRIGEYADPEEALHLLVEAHPQKEVIMKANVGNGTGNSGGGGNKGGGHIIKRADFEKLSPMQQAETSKKAGAGEMKIVD